MSSSTKARARAWISRSSGVRSYMGGPPASLTDGSVYVSVGAVGSEPRGNARALAGSRADAVVVGGGTVGGWCAYFLKKSGAGRVVLIDKGPLGQGASSR